MAVPSQKIKEIAGHIRQSSATKNRTSFIIGAGASVSAGIPTAAGLVKEIQEDFAHCLHAIPEHRRNQYGACMAELAPVDRESLLQPKLDDAKINWGQIALASMIKASFITRVLSFNFDLILEKAVSLLGMQVPVYDFGVAPSGNIHQIARQSIIHLHGQSYGLVLLNTEKEMQDHKVNLHPILSDTVRTRNTIVFGYSGETDASFETIRDEFNSYHRLIWLGYGETPPRHLKPLLEKDYAEYVGGCDFDLVMIALAKELGIWPPMICRNPLSHLIEELEPVTDYPVSDETGLDILTSLRDQLRQGANSWTADEGDAGSIARLVMDGNIEPERLEGLIEKADQLPDKVREQLAWVFLSRAISLFKRAAKGGEDTEARFAEAYLNHVRAIEIKPDLHEAFNSWGITLDKQAKTLTGEAAAALLREAGKKYTRAVEIEPKYHGAFYNWGCSLIEQAKTVTGEAAAALFREAERKLKSAKDLSGKGSYNLACLYALTGKPEEAVEELRLCCEDGTLPDKEYLESDSDMVPLHDFPPYQELVRNLD